jgi:hypothetical protein
VGAPDHVQKKKKNRLVSFVRFFRAPLHSQLWFKQGPLSAEVLQHVSVLAANWVKHLHRTVNYTAICAIYQRRPTVHLPASSRAVYRTPRQALLNFTSDQKHLRTASGLPATLINHPRESR